MHDLEGDIVATAADNTTETKLLSTYNNTEFGVPNGGKTPPPFAWLGAVAATGGSTDSTPLITLLVSKLVVTGNAAPVRMACIEAPCRGSI